MGLTRSWQRPTTWNSAIDALACLELEGLETSPRAVGGAAARLAKQGQWVRLLELLVIKSSKNFQPDLRIAGCCLWSPWPHALHLLAHLASNLAAASDAVLHSSAMKTLGKRWRRVLRLLEEPGYQLNHIHLSLLMVSSSHDSHDSHDGPDGHDTWRLATSLLPWWRQRGAADGPMVSSGIAACNQGRQWQLGAAIFQENRMPGRSRATSEVIGAFDLGPRQWPCSLALFASLCHWRGSVRSVDVACLTRAVGSAERQSAWRISLDLLARGQQFTWDLLTFNLALNVYGRSNWRSALALLFSTSDGPSPDAVSYGCLVQTCCRAQEMEKAQELVKEADSQGALSPVTWTLLALGARWSSAAQLLAAARQRRQVDATLHRAVMSSCEAPGRWREALQLLQQLAPADATAVAFGSSIAACGVPTWKEALSLLEVAETRLVPVASIQLAAALKTVLRWRVVLALEDAYHCGDIISCELAVSSAVLGRSFVPIGRLLDEATDSSLALMNYLMGCNFPSGAAGSRRVVADGSKWCG
ncbi:unnamed protein product [Cladocopium goreaui]|uniref:Pentacotripeptide-repeat region of PRORP domain-containing protein n=1 Tax=Cladocopium goreaui TaxID=2562237 RepID=A0A9P1GB51_9DINO|nr:unnamed protein product [Cladocopium goreaui]